MPLWIITFRFRPAPTASTWCSSAFLPQMAHFLFTRQQYRYRAISGERSSSESSVGISFSMQNSMRKFKNSFAVLISTLDSEKYSQPVFAMKSYFISALISSGTCPDHMDISLIVAYIFLRWSALIVRPSSSLISHSVILRFASM
ncbi:hypothetical protein CAGA_25210 [Caproiciproducens galactitolivorans]|uniref:Uncharacterized protein n=1 Tax=Caproiciproducens galactitolivorans TaxID=642589 RepID=A0A4Z0Y7P3_9FIRM|nr:hypothetical protein CAGA_25210 [Caproiciproducens galactitolivorans]